MAGRHYSGIPKRYSGARDTTFARSAPNNWIPKRDGYIHTYILEIRMRSRVPRAANVWVLLTHSVSRHFRNVSAAGMYR